jgi:hypothetical protein
MFLVGSIEVTKIQFELSPDNFTTGEKITWNISVMMTFPFHFKHGAFGIQHYNSIIYPVIKSRGQMEKRS